MKFYSLSQPVTITGRTLWAFGVSMLTCKPAGTVHGFDPLVIENGKRTPLTLDITSIKRRRIEAAASGCKIKAVEHYSSLRFLFPGLVLAVGNQECPHLTCAGPLVRKLMQQASLVDIEVPWFTVRHAHSWGYQKLRSGMNAHTYIQSSGEKKLRICVTVNFKGFGEMTKSFIFPDQSLLLEILDAEPLGFPYWMERPAKLLWPHARNTYWPKKNDKDVLETIIHHRVHDILGAIALLKSPVEGGFPALNIYSRCSGHEADLQVLRQVETIPL